MNANNKILGDRRNNIMEKISLIIDSKRKLDLNEEEKEILQNKKFLKSLGLKSDSVGWTEINLESSIAKEQMEKINNYVQSNDKRIRIGYEWRKPFTESKWYIIEPAFLNQEIRFFKTDKASGDSYCAGICSYKVPRAENIIEWDFMKATVALVSKQFMECSKKYGLTGADFVWAYDGGRYYS